MKKLVILFLGLLISVNTVWATQLPAEVEAYVKKSFPSATIRFDGLVSLPDGTMYLPLFPSLSPKGKEFGIKYSVPKNAQLSRKPDLLIFNNNFALIKLIKQKKGGYKVYFQESYPTEIITGILPQDLLVPKGLVLPDSLESTLGNLVIPTSSAISYSKVIIKPQQETAKNSPKPKPKQEETVKQVSNVLNNKLFFVANSGSKTIKIVHSDKVDPTFTFKLANVPQDILATKDNQYLFVVAYGQSMVDVIDIKREEIVKQIDCEVQPSSLYISKDGKTLFIASEKGNSIFVVDIKTMALTKKIKVMGAPKYVSFNKEESKLYYFDKLSSNIYSLDLKTSTFVNTEILSCPNVSAIAIEDKELYILSRTRNKFITYSTEINEIISEYDLPDKPVDMLVNGDKIHILCAKDSKIVVINRENGTMEKIVTLASKGFARRLNRVGNSDIVLVSDALAGSYNVYDMAEQKVLQKNKISIPVSVMVIIDRMGIDKL